MSTATAPKKRKSASVSRDSTGVRLPGDPPITDNRQLTTDNSSHTDGNLRHEESGTIDVAHIAPSPWQPRRNFDAAELQGLADSMASHGLRQAIAVRELGLGRYELLAGERRLRAAKLLGWEEIRVSVQEATDDEAREIVLLENLQRKDLSAIEEAEGFRQILSGPGAPTQMGLAQRLGVTQGHISNRLRLLKLPKVLQEYVISGEMPASIARNIVPLVDCPPVIEALQAKLKQAKSYAPKATMGDVLNDPYDGFWSVVEDATVNISGQCWIAGMNKSVPKYQPTPEERAELDIREFDFPDGKELRACNVKLWEKLQAAHVERLKAKAAKKGARNEGLGAGGKKGNQEKPLTAADQKALAEEERRRQKERREQLARRREAIALDWLRWLIAGRIQDQFVTTADELLELTISAALHGWASHYKAQHIERAVGKLRDAATADRACRLVAECFWNSADNCPTTQIGVKEVIEAARLLLIDLPAAWAKEQLGPLTEAWWQAHDRDELVKIGAGIVNSNMKKGELVGVLSQTRDLPLPTELTKLLPAKKEKRR